MKEPLTFWQICLIAWKPGDWEAYWQMQRQARSEGWTLNQLDMIDFMLVPVFILVCMGVAGLIFMTWTLATAP